MILCGLWPNGTTGTLFWTLISPSVRYLCSRAEILTREPEPEAETICGYLTKNV
jgi:hypothetical protein